MRTHMLSACATAIALNLSGPAMAQNSVDPMLQAQIAVSWNAPIQGLAQVLAERLALPYFDGSGAAMATVVLNQGESATVAQAMESINAQLLPSNLILRLSQGAQGQRLELAKTQPDSTVAAVTVGLPAPVSAPSTVPSPPKQVIFNDKPLAIELATQKPAAIHASAIEYTSHSEAVTVTKKWLISANDKTVRQAFLKWGKQAGYTVVWDVPKDINIDAEAEISGTFEDAIKGVLEAISVSDYPVEAVAYDNRVLRIVKTARNANAGAGK